LGQAEEYIEKLVAALRKQQEGGTNVLQDQNMIMAKKIEKLQRELRRLEKSNQLEIVETGGGFSKRSRSPNTYSRKDAAYDEMVYVVGTLCKDAHAESYEDLIQKVRDLKEFQRKHQKERKLIVNMQKLMKDVTTAGGPPKSGRTTHTTMDMSTNAGVN